MVELTFREWIKVATKKALSYLLNSVCLFDATRALTRPAITIIVYHRLTGSSDQGISPYISVTTENFVKQVQFFSKNFTLITLSEAVDILNQGRIDENYLVITFDDGYRDNLTLGLDVFLKTGIRPTIFITTQCMDTGMTLWPDMIRNAVYDAHPVTPYTFTSPSVILHDCARSKIAAVKQFISHCKDLNTHARLAYIANLAARLGTQIHSKQSMLNWTEVAQLSENGIEIGSHTVNHPMLSKTPNHEALFEISESKSRIEDKIKIPVDHFAYPNGTTNDYDENTISLLEKAGYKSAVTTIRGVNRQGADLFQLRRTGIYHTDSLAEVKAKLAIETLIR